MNITLITDFGTKDWFVGTMKGVMASIAPKARIVDLTHEIEPGDIRGGAFALAASYRFFPKGTVHVAVVDPGVGSARRAVAVRTANYYFVAPDNGLLSLALAKENIRAIRLLDNAEYFLQPVSRTFHGRDVFAPVAAHLARGVPIQKFGPELKGYERLPWPEPGFEKGGWTGQVVYVDRFGNAITNIADTALRSPGAELLAHVGRKRIPVAEFYQAVAPGRPVAVPGSSGFVEIAMNGGNAAQRLGLKPGSSIRLRPREKS